MIRCVRRAYCAKRPNPDDETDATMPQTRFNRALLMNPPTGLYRRDDRCQCRVEDQTVQIVFPPLELCQLGTVLKRAGAEVLIRDYPAMGRGMEALVEDFNSFKPDMVLVNIVTATAEQDFAALALARETLGPNLITLAKGEYMEALGEVVLRDHDWIDFGFHGEVEIPIEKFYRGESLENVEGLIWRMTPETLTGGKAESEIEISVKRAPEWMREKIERGSQSEICTATGAPIRRNPGHPLAENLDELPWPDRSLLDNGLYLSPETGNPLTVIQGNRGCPSKCIFCPAGSMSGYRVRFRSPAAIMAEIDECVTKFGIREFLFHGDTFTINKKWLVELCDLIIASGHKIHWGCNSRVDTMDDERAQKLKAAGCWVVAFGIETGSQMIMDKMKKGQKIERGAEAIACCKRNGLRTHAFMVIGMPWETKATLEETYQMARRLDTDFFDFNIAYPLPGTEYYEIAVRDGLFEEGAAAASYAEAGVRTYELSSEDLNKWRRSHLLKMYFRPHYIFRMLTSAGGPRQTLNYIKAGLNRLKQLVKK